MNDSNSLEDPDAQLYQSIGELVIVTQSVENQYRKLGWFIHDPRQSTWPPRTLRKESLARLIDVVTAMFVELIGFSNFPNGDGYTQIAAEVQGTMHQLRNYRNQVLHSAFVEMKAGDETVGFCRADTKVGVDSEKGNFIGNLESISAKSVRATLATFGKGCIQLNTMYTQVIHWYGLEDGARWRSNSPTT